MRNGKDFELYPQKYDAFLDNLFKAVKDNNQAELNSLLSAENKAFFEEALRSPNVVQYADGSSTSFLNFAAFEGNQEAVRALIAAGANPLDLDSGRQNTFDLASSIADSQTRTQMIQTITQASMERMHKGLYRLPLAVFERTLAQMSQTKTAAASSIISNDDNKYMVQALGSLFDSEPLFHRMKYDELGNKFARLFDSIGRGLGIGADAAKNAFIALGEALKTAWNKINDLFKSIGNGIAKAGKEAAKAVADFAKTTGKAVADALKPVMKAISAFLDSTIGQPIKKAGMTAYKAYLDVKDKSIEKIFAPLGETVEKGIINLNYAIAKSMTGNLESLDVSKSLELNRASTMSKIKQTEAKLRKQNRTPGNRTQDAQLDSEELPQNAQTPRVKTDNPPSYDLEEELSGLRQKLQSLNEERARLRTNSNQPNTPKNADNTKSR